MLSSLEANGKRLIFFTKVIFTLFVVNLLLFINYIDMIESNRVADSLAMLKDTYLQTQSENMYFNKYDLDRVNWLEKNDSANFNLHMKARQDMLAFLEKYGKRISFEEKGGEDGSNVFRLMYAGGFEDYSDIHRIREHRGNSADFIVDDSSVSTALECFDKYSAGKEITFLAGIDTNRMKKIMDSLILEFIERRGRVNSLAGLDSAFADSLNALPVEERYNQEINENFEYVATVLKGDSLYILWRNNSSDFKPMTQTGPETYLLECPVNTFRQTLPSVIDFSGFKHPAIQTLKNNRGLRTEVKKKYGYYKLSMVSDLSASTLKKYEEPVSILGFDISRRWFPVMLMVCLTIIYSLLYITIRKAASGGEKIITGYESDDSWDMLINYKWLRASLWVLSPLLLVGIVLYSTLIQYGVVTYSGMILAGLTCFLMGYLSYKSSHKL